VNFAQNRKVRRLTYDQRDREISRKATMISTYLRKLYPELDSKAISFAAALRTRLMDPDLERKAKLSKEDYGRVLECFEQSGMYAAALLRKRLGEEKADKVRQIIMDHLEHFDGSGPHQKRANEILPEAQILNLACAVQNMIEGKPNRRQSDGSIVENIMDLAGKQYSPEMVMRAMPSVQLMLLQEDPEILRLTELGRVSSGMLHDMTDYLSVTHAYLTRIAGFPHDPNEVKEWATEGLASIDKIVAFRTDMLAFARGREKMVEGNLNTTLDEAIEHIHKRLRHATLEKNYNHIPLIPYSEVGMKHLFINILTNAAESVCNKDGTIVISTYEENNYVVISISDNGKGMDSDHLDNIFEGKSTKHDGGGIGARFCKYLIEKHNGPIFQESQPVIE
jgi:hypothetical protein